MKLKFLERKLLQGLDKLLFFFTRQGSCRVPKAFGRG
jgi:hypothetical protein